MEVARLASTHTIVEPATRSGTLSRWGFEIISARTLQWYSRSLWEAAQKPPPRPLTLP
jgi:hypothetical protein